jgi:beta-lactamase superfamily II metal-dependent hydrolase
MRTTVLLLGMLVCLAAPAPSAAQAAKTLDIYFIDVEGGQATLIVSPSGESLLVDAGWPGFDGRDADRIAAAAKQAGVSKIDYLVSTHYHTDHIGGVPALAAKLPVGTFVDHGPSVEHEERAEKLFQDYAAARAKGKHLQVKPGDTIPVKGLDVRVVAAGGEHLANPLPNGGRGAGQPNPLCADFKPKEPDPSENARSVGIVVRLDSFRFVDLGDLTWNKEQELACPANVIGAVDVYLTTHHGLDASNAPALVHALRPRVAIMNNGAKKGGSPAAWQVIHDSPGLEGLWQVHFATAGGADHNAAEAFIANPDETTSFGIKVSAHGDGSFTVTNARTGATKSYPARR